MRFKQRFLAAAILFPVFLVAASKTSTPPTPVVAPVANQTGSTPSAQPAAQTQAPPSVRTQSASSGSSTPPVSSIPATKTPIPSDQGTLGIEVSSIGGQAVRTSPYERAEKGKGRRTAGFIGGGAGGGALIGGLAGGGKGALIGGLIGAGAGTAGAALSGNKDIVIPSESVVTFHLTAPVTVERTR